MIREDLKGAITRLEVNAEEGSITFEFSDSISKKDIVHALNEAYEIMTRLLDLKPAELSINKSMEVVLLSLGHDEVGSFSLEMLKEGPRVIYHNSLFGYPCSPLETDRNDRPVMKVTGKEQSPCWNI